jgi:acyl-CoA thioester hydrolase
MLRLLQETATRASTDAGFDPAYYDRVGGMWLVRRTILDRLVPIRYGTTLTARTWVADFRRVRSERRYELHAGDRLVAEGATDWVFVDRATTQPRRIPAEFEQTLASDDTPLRTRDRTPPLAPPPDAHRSERRVEAHELDALRHVNNAAYAHYVEQGVLDACSALGWPLAAAGRFRAAAYDLEYLDSALYDDRLVIATWPIAATERDVAWRTHVARAADGRELLRAATTWTWGADGVAAPLPDELLAAVRARLELRASGPSGIVAAP